MLIQTAQRPKATPCAARLALVLLIDRTGREDQAERSCGAVDGRRRRRFPCPKPPCACGRPSYANPGCLESAVRARAPTVGFERFRLVSCCAQPQMVSLGCASASVSVSPGCWNTCPTRSQSKPTPPARTRTRTAGTEQPAHEPVRATAS